MKQVARFEQSSREKQINPSSPQLIKADAPSVRESEVAGAGTFSRADFSSHAAALALGSARRQSAAQFFCPAVPDQHYKYSTAERECECERESQSVFSGARARSIYSEQKLWPLSRLFICRWGFESLGLCPNHESRKLLISTTNGKVANNTLTISRQL